MRGKLSDPPFVGDRIYALVSFALWSYRFIGGALASNVNIDVWAPTIVGMAMVSIPLAGIYFSTRWGFVVELFIHAMGLAGLLLFPPIRLSVPSILVNFALFSYILLRLTGRICVNFLAPKAHPLTPP